MTKDKIEERAKKVIVEHLGVNESTVIKKANFKNDLGADSLDMVELLMAFEEEFEIVIPDDDAEKIKTVDDAIKYLQKAAGE